MNWGRGPASWFSPGLLDYSPWHLWNVGWQPQPSPPCPPACLLLLQQEQPRVMKEGGFIDKEKAELWVSTHNTAPRVHPGLGSSPSGGAKGPFTSGTLLTPTILSFPASPFLATPRPSMVTLWTKSVAATGGEPGPEFGLRLSEYGGSKTPFSSASFCAASQGLPQPTPASEGGGQSGNRQAQQPQPTEPSP